jgi:hypothetical protein
VVINDDQLDCTECGEVHDVLTRTPPGQEDGCHFPALFEESLMYQLMDEDGLFMGGRPIEIPLMTETELILNDRND